MAEYADPEVRRVLQLCADYFSDRSDAEYFTDSPSPSGNEEMQILVEIMGVLEKVQ